MWYREVIFDQLNLLILAEKDQIVPSAHMRGLYKIVNQSSDYYHHFESFPNGGHNTLANQEEYYPKLERFVQKVVASRLKGEDLKTLFPIVPDSFWDVDIVLCCLDCYQLCSHV